MNKNYLIELVKYCGGDVSKIDEFMSRKIETIEDLKAYPNKEHYSSLISSNKSPELYELVRYLYDGNRYSVISLNRVLEGLDHYLEEKAYEYEFEDKDAKDYINKVHEQLINLKFGSMEYDW